LSKPNNRATVDSIMAGDMLDNLVACSEACDSGKSWWQFLGVINLCLGRYLKLLGFVLNITASLYLISRVLFRDSASFMDFLRGGEITGAKTTWGDLLYLNRDMLITSTLVIIGSTLQFTGDLIDPCNT